MPTKDKATSDESIGRPGPWQEGRYQQSGEALDNSAAPAQPLDTKNPVAPQPGADISAGPVSTPVHLDEYTGAAHAPADKPADHRRR